MNRNVSKIVASSMGLQIVIAISGFILPKFFIETYGSEVNGLINSIKQFITYFSSVSLGLAAASSAALYKPLHDKNENKVNGILSATRIFFNRTGILFSGFILVLSFTYPIVVSSNIKSGSIFLIILILGFGGICEYILVSKYRVLLVSDQKNYVVSRITAEGVLINLFISVVMIYQGFNYIWVQVVATSIYIFRLLSTKRYVKKNYPYVNYYNKPDFDSISGRWDAFFYEIPKLIVNYSPILITTIFMNLTWVSVYSIYNMIFSSLFMIISVFTTGINAVFGNLFIEDTSASLYKKFKLFKFVFNIIMIVLLSSSLALVLPFINIYIQGEENYAFSSLAFGFVLLNFMRSYRLPYNVVIEATGKFKENKNPNIIESLFFLVLSIIGVQILGILGILISGIVTSFIRNIYYISFVDRNIMGLVPVKSIIEYVYSLSVMLGSALFIKFFIVDNFVINNYMMWFFVAILVSISSCVLVVVFLAPFNKENIIQIIKRVNIYFINRKNKL